MGRFDRRKFDFNDLATAGSDEARAQLLFDWWCDDSDRETFLQHVERGGRKLHWILGREQVEDDPAPPRSRPRAQGHAPVALITDPADVAAALANPRDFSNLPYAEIGGASFMLALDPPAAHGARDWHAEQRAVATDLLGRIPQRQLEAVAQLAVKRAAVLSLRSASFDLAEYAEQAALRYFALAFGYSAADHAVLEDAARRGYRALQYVIVGRHFTSEPATFPLAQQALARLATRTSALLHDYARLQRGPRKAFRPGPPPADASWPEGVQTYSEAGLGGLADPLLRLLPGAARSLGGQDLCNMVGGLLVGMVGNVQTSLCLMVQSLLEDSVQFNRLRHQTVSQLAPEVAGLLARTPPVPFLPRRTGNNGAELKAAGALPANIDCLLALRPSKEAGCPWGEGRGNGALHSCLGRSFVEPLLAQLLHQVLQLPDLEEPLDPVNGELLKPERLWGFGVSRYGLRHRRDKLRAQQPLIVVMPIKSPIAENAERLRQVIRNAAPRVQEVLDRSRMVHMAWFEFMDNDTRLALRTVYDGDFDSYVQHFALAAGELFDLIFASIEGGPPLPVAEHPNEFVETIRRYNRTPLGGYFYSAYPTRKVTRILGEPE